MTEAILRINIPFNGNGWIGADGMYTSRVMRIRGNLKTDANTVDTVYGCTGGKTNEGHGCHWGCYAKYNSKRHGLGKTGFDTPVKQILDEDILRGDIGKMKLDWVRIGVSGDPCFDWELTTRTTEIIHEEDKIPVVMSRFWELPTWDQLERMAKAHVNLQASVCALDKPGFWARMKDMELMFNLFTHENRATGKFVFRLVTFHFNDTTQSGKIWWEIQDRMAAWNNVIEQPARVTRTNPVYKKWLPDWAYFKALSTAEHKFYATAHRFTAGMLYPHLLACWVGCKNCKHQCATKEENK